MSRSGSFACNACPPERSLAVADILTLPLEYVQNMNDAVVSPIDIEDTIEHCKRWEGGWKSRKKHFAQYTRSKSRIRRYQNMIE
jgi:hypothetical protein